jgi:predicted MFS family arabinose efflux permease
VAINSVIFNSARFLGPALSGIIIAAGSISLAFAINGASYLAVMAALASLSLKRAPPEGARRRNILATTVDGYRYAARHHGIGSLLLLMAVTSVCLRGFIELLPGFTDAVFHRGPQALAWLTAITGLGAVVGGLWMVRRPALAGLTAVVVANTLVMAAALFCFTLTAYFWLALPCLFVAGFGLVVTGIGAQTLVQTAVEPAMRGRIMALYGTIFRGGPAVCALVMGTLSSSFGMRAPLAAGAVLCAGCWAWARLRQEGVARELESLPA